MTIDLKAYIARQIEERPVEADIVRRVYAALEEAGTPVLAVDDRYEEVNVSSIDEVLEQVFNLDDAILRVEEGGWVRLTMGEEWDIVCDYTVNLEDALKPVQDWISENEA